MANYFLCLTIFRIALPIILSICVLFRPSGLSALYLLLLYYLPFVPVPTRNQMSGHTGRYLIVLIVVSVLASLCQFAFQIVLLVMQPYGHFLKNCEFLEKLLRHIGFVRLDDISPISGLTWLSPEILLLLTSITFYFSLKKIVVSKRNVEDKEGGSKKKKRKHAYIPFFTNVGRYVVLFAFCLAAVLRPSVVGGLYFLIFLTSATCWACCVKLQKGFAILLRCLIPVVLLHLSALYAYQFQWCQELLAPDSPYPRYFGLTPIFSEDCTADPRDIIWMNNEWATYVNPLALYWLFYLLVLESRGLMRPELIRGVSPNSKSMRRYSDRNRPGIFQDSTGSVTVTGEPENIPMSPLEDGYSPTVFDNILFVFESILQVIIKASYVATNIIMMTWSITYLSWITFVLLIWANIIWLMPQQRKSMLRSSPFLVLYAWFLLLSAYIYSMNLTEDELPSKIQNLNLSQIGFQKVTILPCNPLLVKCFYTVFFWISLRQYVHEKMEQRQSNALADMVAPLQVTVGTAAGVSEEQTKSNKLLNNIGNHIKHFLTKFWIWVVAITLFAVAITGDRMTGFRIIYMALFLFFILTFQLSFRLWRRIMFGFWLTVIIFSMIILVMVYTYQFDNFPEYWSTYLHVPLEQQADIGLELFPTKLLFVRLFTPTFFVIITVIQLHYFHKDFMAFSDPKNASTSIDDGSSVQEGAGKSSVRDDVTSVKYDLSEIGQMTTVQIQKILENILEKLHYTMNLSYLFLEIHMPKIILLFAMLLSIYDKCALYLVVVILISLSCVFGRPVFSFSIYISSVLISLLLLARMIYQIQYIHPEIWDLNCTTTEGNETVTNIVNNALWLGFNKTSEENSLPSLVKWNIIYILVITVFAVVQIRQSHYRMSRMRPTRRAFFMFPRITRNEADQDLSSCIKYLFNYAFYKFGVELSLMATVALIGFRMDMYAIIYSIWLCILVPMNRLMLSKVWYVYLIFAAVLLPIQYIMAVGLPPSLCIDYPWDSSPLLRRLQDWAYLFDLYHPPSVKKLLCDFIVLLFVSRQALVFRIERRYPEAYPGGSNESIIHHAEERNFENPVPDFITYVKSYLDIFKQGFLLGFLWFTLAIVFLAGTNRVNVFSIGYLIGAFAFLWQGTDIYLRPIPKILKAWNWLLGFNVAVITLKAIFQLLGCVFIEEISFSCWTVQLFGVSCVKKFGSITKEVGIEDPDTCQVPREYVGMVWDGLCFGFLIVQRRIFNSYNFFHIVDETKATTILASRGAELIEELRTKRIHEQEEQERKVLEKIKAKMDRIKATQQRIHTELRDESHVTDSVLTYRPRYRRKPPQTYKQAIRSGDYYMFDDMDDDEKLDLMPIKTEYIPPEDEPPGQTVGKVPDSGPKTVTIADEPKPGTSKDDDEDISDLTEPKEQSFGLKILDYLLVAWLFVESLMISVIRFLNTYSKDYRYLVRVLRKEKKILKEKTEYTEGFRLGSAQVWQPAHSYQSLVRQSMESDDNELGIDTEMSSYDQPTIIRLLLAIWHIIMSRSELLCYFVIFVYQIKNATFLSLPLPLMVFLWGTLTLPRPSKTFWVTIIAYTEVMVLIKCMFQFDIIPWNQNINLINDPFYPPRIIGIERQKYYAVWDLLLLLVVFFHRLMLKSMGIWKSTYTPATLLSDGEYKYEDGQLKAIELSPPGTPIKEEASDMEQLVGNEESENKEEHVVRSIPSSNSSASESSEENEDVRDSILSAEAKDNIFIVTSKKEDATDHLQNILQLTMYKYGEAMQTFFQHLLDPTSRAADDVYSYMFLCDFFNFFVILIGYSSFGAQQGDGGVSSYLEDNRVPALFLVMLILQFMLIIIDRGIFLRKNILGKIIFQFSQVFLLHLWLFVLFPIMTGSRFNTVLPPQMYYMVKCFYLLLSAYQIRCGYPTRILGNFLCKGYNYVNMFLFKGFMAIPFLFELRTVMDWMWTDTSMTVFDWIKMEDIFAHIFQLKCSRHVEDEYPQPRGERKKLISKYLMGGGILAVIIAVIWFPLVFFSLGNAVGEPNVPYDVTLEIRIGPYEPVYQMSAQSNFIYSFNENEMSQLIKAYQNYKSSITFITNYESSDIAAVQLSTNSANIWSISPPDRERMLEEVQSSRPLSVRLEYKISHKTSKPEDSGVIPDNVEISIPAGTPARNNLLQMLQGKPADPISLTRILPKFFKVTNRGTAKPITQLMDSDYGDSQYRDISLRLLRPENSTDSGKEWWQVHENCTDKNYQNILKNIPYADCKSIILYTFNDKIFPATLNIITGGGIIGLYTTLVFLASRVLRGFFAEQCFKIMFEDMPNVDRVLQLCLDVYLVREAREFALEEDLFAKLVFLFRSPETLIKWTRPKEELDDDEDPEGAD